MLAKFFNLIIEKISAVLTWIGNLYKAVMTAGWDFIRDAACWPFEQIMDIVVSAIQAIDMTGLASQVGAWGSLPAELLNILGLLGIGTASAIIVAAIGVRLVLQLIPFVRLGS
ncbi:MULTISPECIES: DUF2523 family protein [unclassified Acidovorax]|uniref:DUF2523 family protein n=1 Tax=unclassified Acidovorax TaxID=2684926 RepID=UPI000701829C|nr:MULTISPECIES: DUF2523 family protein [unclassified Acidovorax]KQW25700.1 hypothetical protein ASC83_05890 [Acidovorax sp. Root402]MCT6717872.1 DUF2523 family protein [Acidovorax sp. K2F]